jgi:hypothetical protein
MQGTNVRIDLATHQELKRLAAELGSSVEATVALAVRRLRQDQIGAQLSDELTPTEVAWLDAELEVTSFSRIWGCHPVARPASGIPRSS